LNILQKFHTTFILLLLFINAGAQENKNYIPVVNYNSNTSALPPKDTIHHDLADVINKIWGKEIINEDDTTLKRKGKVYLAFLPAAGYTLQTSFAATINANGAFYTDDPKKENLSVISIEPIYSIHKQFYVLAQSDIWSRENKYNFVGAYGIYKYPQNTYGLGGHTSLSNPDLINYDYVRLREAALRKIIPDFFAGIGYALDYHWNITETGLPNGEPSDFDRYGKTSSSTSSGITWNILYDTRRNPINPPKGYYINIVYRQNTTFLGSNQNWQSLLLDNRAYFKLSKNSDNVLAIWSYDWLTLSGNPPYLDLPSTAWDAYANQGRGYIQSRFRGKNLLSMDVEYRFGITRDGLIGGVVFVNSQAVSNWPDNTINAIWPATGIGIRIKINKHSNTNLAVDYGVGLGGSNGFFINLGEVF
jgi:hypothetical protein